MLTSSRRLTLARRCHLAKQEKLHRQSCDALKLSRDFYCCCLRDRTEAGFFKLRAMKIYLRSSMRQEGLSGLAVLATENGRARSLDAESVGCTYSGWVQISHLLWTGSRDLNLWQCNGYCWKICVCVNSWPLCYCCYKCQWLCGCMYWWVWWLVA